MLSRELLAGRKIVVHCKGGLGRAGTIASMLLLDTGEAQDGDGAIGMVRRVRPGAIETSVQEVFIRRVIPRRLADAKSGTFSYPFPEGVP